MPQFLREGKRHAQYLFLDDSQFRVWPLLPLNFQLCSVIVVTVGGNCGLVHGPRCVAAPACPTCCPLKEMRKPSIYGVGSMEFARFLSVSTISLFVN